MLVAAIAATNAFAESGTDGETGGDTRVSRERGHCARQANSTTASDVASDCPRGYVSVPPLAPYTDRPFCIMKYEAKLQYDGRIVADGNFDTGDGLADDFDADYEDPAQRARYRAVSVREGRPWVQIRRGGIAAKRAVQGAVEACRLSGPGYDLMANDDWQTVVRNVAGTPVNWIKPSNWNKDREVDRALNHGHSDADPPQSCDGFHEYVEKDCAATACEDDLTEKRTNMLSNGQVIWDLGGNVNEWVKDDHDATVHGKAGLWKVFTNLDYTAYPAVQTDFGPAKVDCDNPQGERHCGFGFLWDGKAGAVLRGSYWVYGVNAGMFTTVLFFAPDHRYKGSGFRCVYRP
jgi:hypothetical protein